jgi:replication-associated recombination protein RarA
MPITSRVQLGNQLEAMTKGHTLFQQLTAVIRSVTSENSGQHLYLYGRPGVGKTYNVKKALYEAGAEFIEVLGNTSAFAFGLKICLIQHLRNSNEPMTVLVDDCDELLKNEANCNILKNVLSGPKVFQYEKSLSSQWGQLTESHKQAIKYFQDGLSSGFTVPVKNISFIFTSNTRLPFDDEVQLLREKGSSKSTLYAHRNAIRSRVRVVDLELNEQELWGWIANIVMSETFLPNIEGLVKMEMLNFLYENWDDLKEKSLRLVEKMAETHSITNNYQSLWKIEFLKRT